MEKRVKRKCYTYTRVSTFAQTEGFSLEGQSARLHEYAQYRDLEIAEEYCDAGKSGKDIKGRPAFQQMMEDIICQKDDIAYVLVFKLSRFGRNAADILRSMQTLTDYGVDLVCVEDGIDSSTQGGRLTLAILSAVAEIERENITVQFMAGRRQKIMDGKWSGGVIPYGYWSVNKELTIVPEEAKMVARIFDLYLQDGMKATSVVAYLNDNGYEYRRVNRKESQRPFTYDLITGILDNPIYCGRLVFGRRTNKKGKDGKILKVAPENIIYANGVHEKIITEEQWKKVQEKRKALADWGKKTDDPDRISLLSGLVKCPLCGCGMISKKDQHINKNHGGYYKTLHYYYCANSRKANGRVCSFTHSYNQEKVDDAVFEIVRKLAGLSDFKRAVSAATEAQTSVSDLEDTVKALRKELRGYEMQNRRLGMELDGLDVLKEDYDKRYDEIQGRIDEGYEKIDVTEQKIAVTLRKIEAANQGIRAKENIEKMLVNFQKLYNQMTCEEKREMYRLFIERIEVFPDERVSGRILKSITFRFAPEYAEQSMTAVDESDDTVQFTLDCSSLESTVAESKATYVELKRYIMELYGVKVSTLYIAQTKRKYGLDMRANYNLPSDPEKPVAHHCPPEKEAMIVEALKHYRMLEQEA